MWNSTAEIFFFSRPISLFLFLPLNSTKTFANVELWLSTLVYNILFVIMMGIHAIWLNVFQKSAIQTPGLARRSLFVWFDVGWARDEVNLMIFACRIWYVVIVISWLLLLLVFMVLHHNLLPSHLRAHIISLRFSTCHQIHKQNPCLRPSSMIKGELNWQ